MMRDLSDLSDLTYKEIFTRFLERVPEYQGRVSDYRPARLPYTLQVWLTDGSCIYVTYMDASGMFTVTSKPGGE